MTDSLDFKEISSILLGKTGHGKSTLCNLLGDTNSFMVSDSIHSCTKSIKSQIFINQKNQVKIAIIDTPGFCDSDGEDKSIIEEMKLKLRDKTFPRINTILIVISIQEPRLDKSIQECIKEICKLFPLADFWNHVIIIYTHFNGTENQKRRLKQKGEAFINDFIELTNIINRENSIQINLPNNGIKMIFNEYDATEIDEVIIKLNLEETEKNINKIINYMKDMRPIYSSLRLLGQKDILLSQDTVGKFTIIKYKKVNIIEYEDFKFDNCPPEKIEYEEKISEYNIKREDTETDFILCESESTQDKKSYKRYKKYIYYNMEEQIINEEILKEEIIDWKTLEKKEELEINEINESKKMLRKIEYILECTKDNPQGIKKEQKTLDEYIEEWKEEDPKLEMNLDDNHCGSIKYKFYKYLYQIRQGNTIKLENTKKEVTEKNYEEIYEKDTELKNKIEEENGTQYKITFYNIIKKDTRRPGIKYSTEYTIQVDKQQNCLERFEKRQVKILNNKIYNQNYKIFYIKEENGNEKVIKEMPIGEEEEIDLQTKEYYELEGLTKSDVDRKRRNKEYPIEYKRVYYIEELNTKEKKTKKTNKIENIIINIEHRSQVIDEKGVEKLEEYDKEIFHINGRREEQTQKLNRVEYILQNKIDNREMKIENNKIYYNIYKIYYYIDSQRMEKFYKEVIIGNDEVDLKTKEYYELEGLTINDIERKRKNKEYPIEYKRIYYIEELNTKDKKKIKTNKIENIIINIEHHSEQNNIGGSDRLEEYDKEIFDINGKKEEQTQKLNRIERILQTRIDKREMKIENLKIYYNIYKIYYYIDNQGKEKFYKEMMIDNDEVKLEIKEYYELEGLTNSDIDIKRKNKEYPIEYERVYYIEELNTDAKRKIKTDRVENIIINIEHIVNEFTIEGSERLEEYDREIFFINGEKEVQTQKLNRIEHILQTKTIEKEYKIQNDKIYYDVYKIYYYLENQIEIYHKKVFVTTRNVDINYKHYSEDSLTESEIRTKRKNKNYPIQYTKVYYKDELNTERKTKKIYVKREEIVIQLHHFMELIEKEDHQYSYEYDQEVYYINGRVDTGIKGLKFNEKYERIKKLVDKIEEIREIEIDEKTHWFRANEHIFRIEKRYKLLYDNGKPDYTDWTFDSYKTYNYG